MKRILMVSYVPLFPNDSGNRSRVLNIFNNLRELGNDVHFIYIDNGNKNVDLKKMEKYVGINKFWRYKNKDKKKLIPTIKRYLRKIVLKVGLSKKIIIHYGIDDIYPESLTDFVCEKMNEIKYDVIWVEYVWYSKLLKYVKNDVLKVIDTHDVFTNREKLFLINNDTPKWYYTTKKEESKGLSRANYVVSIQNKETDFLNNIINNKNTKVVTIGNSIDLTKPKIVKNKNYLFIGSNNDMNINGINLFIKNVLPNVRKREKNSKLIIAGSVCDNIPDSDNYEKLGFVDDLNDLYNSVRLVINPVMSGTGLNIKTIEALGHCKPLVTTKCGIKGLNNDGNMCYIARNDEEFADRIIDVLNDDEVAKILSEQSFHFVKKYNNECVKNIRELIK